MQTNIPAPEKHGAHLFTRGCYAGLLAGILATILMILISLVTGGVSLPAALGSAIAQSLPLSIFGYLHERLGSDAKDYLFYIIVVGQCVVFAVFGGLFNLALARVFQGRWRNEQGETAYPPGLLFALILWLFSGLIFLPLTGAGLFGAALSIGVFNTMFSLAVVGLVFGILYIFIQNWLAWRAWQHEHAEQMNISIDAQMRMEQRRTFVRNGLVILGVSALGYGAYRFLVTGLGGGVSGAATSPQIEDYLLQHYQAKITPPPVPNYGTLQKLPQQSPEITSNDQFYVVSKNFLSDPTVNGSTWKLTVHGSVTQPYTLTYNQLMQFPMTKQYESLMCISNEVGGSYMSNALWEGIPLINLLHKAGSIKPGATKVVLRAADSYSDSIHLAKALEPTTLVAVRMNDVTLPQGHGYPARLLVPGIYGMKHVKWITDIEVVNVDYQGYWQQNGWSDSAVLKMTSRIDTPLENAQLPADHPTYIAGVAFSGNKGISMVEVSMDSGQNWQKAVLQRPFSDLTWVLWQVPWTPQAGNYTLLVRATDLQGNVQDPQTAPPLPDGSSGYHTVSVSVA
jgi:DMSO/TMAO reductase YedYZ molybdopterin-dependent catalytic subunit